MSESEVRVAGCHECDWQGFEDELTSPPRECCPDCDLKACPACESITVFVVGE